MKRWVISDTHFCHTKLVDEGLRPGGFGDTIFRNWKQLVSEGDLVLHIGDVAVPDTKEHVWEMLSRLPGKKVLVRGNHDKRSISWYMRNGFDVACDSIEIGGNLFTHKPLDIVPDHIRFNIHGHLHECVHREPAKNPRCRLVSLEDYGYTPILVDRVLRGSKPIKV